MIRREWIYIDLCCVYKTFFGFFFAFDAESFCENWSGRKGLHDLYFSSFDPSDILMRMIRAWKFNSHHRNMFETNAMCWNLHSCLFNFRHPSLISNPLGSLLKLNLGNLTIWRSTSELLISCSFPLLKQVETIILHIVKTRELWQKKCFMKQNRCGARLKLTALASDWSKQITWPEYWPLIGDSSPLHIICYEQGHYLSNSVYPKTIPCSPVMFVCWV